MNIAVVVSVFPSLSETFILSQITGLLELGHQVDIYASLRGDEAVVHPDIERYRLRARTRYVGAYNVVEGRGRRLARAAAILLRHLPRRPRYVWRWMTTLRSHGIYQGLNTLFTVAPFWDADYDIIHCQFGPVGRKWLFLKRLTRAKYVCAFRGYDLSSYLKVEGPAAYRELFRAGDLFLPVCEAFRRRLEALGCARERILVHHSGIDLARFAPARRERRPGQPVRILTVARLVEKKGLEDAIRAVGRVIARHLDAHYTIVGSGLLEPRLRSLIHELALERHIVLHGPAPRDAVAALMQEADIYLLPSMTAGSGDQEGIPGSLMEAHASGMPVVSTRHSGIPELVLEGRSGYLVPERDVAGLAERLCTLIERPELRSAFGAEGRRIVEQRFDVKALTRQLVQTYADVLRARTTDHQMLRERLPSLEPQDAEQVRPDISVILPTRNRAEQLRGALERLAAQETDGTFTYEVIVVDNGSADGTRSVVEQMAAGFPVPLRYAYEPTAGKPYALNTGLRTATGHIFACMDDDIEPSPEWLAALWRCFQETDADAVTGRILPKWIGTRPAWLTDDALQHVGSIGCIDYGPRRLRRHERHNHKLQWVGGNLAMRRAAAERVGDWDVRMVRAQDTEYYWRSVRKGLEIVYEPAAVVRHRLGGDRMTPAYFRQWRHRSGYYHAYLEPWRAAHFVTLMSAWWYRDTVTFAWRWVIRSCTRRPWVERFGDELRLRDAWSLWWHRLGMWPSQLRAVLARRPGCVGSTAVQGSR